MNGLALDLAGVTGWAVGDNLATARIGIWKLPGYSDDCIDRTLASIYSAVNGTCRENDVGYLILEAALRGVQRTNKRGITTPSSSHGDRCLTMLNGAARAGASNAGVKIIKVIGPSTWRARIFGNGYPTDPKGTAVAYMKRNGRDIADHNACEAGCMLQFGIDEFGLLGRIKP